MVQCEGNISYLKERNVNPRTCACVGWGWKVCISAGVKSANVLEGVSTFLEKNQPDVFFPLAFFFFLFFSS